MKYVQGSLQPKYCTVSFLDKGTPLQSRGASGLQPSIYKSKCVTVITLDLPCGLIMSKTAVELEVLLSEGTPFKNRGFLHGKNPVFHLLRTKKKKQHQKAGLFDLQRNVY